MMDKKEFEKFKKELSTRFYWCKKRKGALFPFGKGSLLSF